MAIVKKYSAELIEKKQLGELVYSLLFKSLKGLFKYKPGQFLHLAIDDFDYSKQWPESRCFSMQSKPNENTLKITFAVKGEFTKRMAKELTIGSLVTLKLPYGDLFTQDHSKENIVFIAGGTGITPFLSLFNDASFANYSNPILYAGFQKNKLNLYKTEIDFAKQINPSFNIHYIYQDEQGVLDIAEILKCNDVNRTFFISGPPIMIKNFKNYLIENGVSVNKIKTDDWE